MFRDQKNFAALGTNVGSDSGIVGVALAMRHQIALLVVRLLLLKHASKKCLQRLLGLLVYPFLHRRECMAAFSEVFKHVQDTDNRYRKLPAQVLDELV